MTIKERMTKKGISPMIATVLLIAFTVAVAGIVSVWITGFTMTSTSQVTEQSNIELYCSYGGIAVSNLKYCNTYLSGIVENTNLVDIGNVTMQIIFDNSTTQKFYLYKNNNTSLGFMAIKPRELDSFNLSIGGSNYNIIHVYTNCSNVYDDARKADVTASC
jgi:flagellin-like protein